MRMIRPLGRGTLVANLLFAVATFLAAAPAAHAEGYSRSQWYQTPWGPLTVATPDRAVPWVPLASVASPTSLLDSLT